MLGHPGVGIIRKIIGNCIGHNLTKFLKTSDFICMTSATGKLILRFLPLKIHTEPLKFLKKDTRSHIYSNTTNKWIV
jgi:hypothetical protein